MKAEIQVVLLQAKGHQRLPTSHQELGQKHGVGAPCQSSEGTQPGDTLFLDSWPLELWDMPVV